MASSKSRRRFIFLVEVEVEGVERLVGVAKLGLLESAQDEAVAASCELVGDERRGEVEGRMLVGLGFEDPCLDAFCHAAEAKGDHAAFELDEIHSVSPLGWVMREMRSR